MPHDNMNIKVSKHQEKEYMRGAAAEWGVAAGGLSYTLKKSVSSEHRARWTHFEKIPNLDLQVGSMKGIICSKRWSWIYVFSDVRRWLGQ